MGISFRPDNFAKGGIIPAGVYRFTGARFGVYEYPNTSQRTFAFVSTLLGQEDGSQSSEQAWSCGDPTAFGASPDGMEIVPAGRRPLLSESTVFYQLCRSLVDSGFPVSDQHPMERADDTFENLVAYLDWEDDPGRAYICKVCQQRFDTPEACQSHQTQQHNDPAVVRKGQVFVVQQIMGLPWEWSGDGAGQTAVGAGLAVGGVGGAPQGLVAPGAVGGARRRVPAATAAAPAQAPQAPAPPRTVQPAAPAQAPLIDDNDLKQLIISRIPDNGVLQLSAMRGIIFSEFNQHPDHMAWMKLLNNEAWKQGLAEVGVAYADNAFSLG